MAPCNASIFCITEKSRFFPRKRRLTRAHTSDSQSFRCFLPFCPWRATDAPASKRTKIPRKSKAVRCEAVLPEQKCSQTRKRPQRILCVFSRALTPYEGISARQNRVCPCQSTQSMPIKRALTDLVSACRLRKPPQGGDFVWWKIFFVLFGVLHPFRSSYSALPE